MTLPFDRALKSVLVMAGRLKRENPQINEDIVLIRALRDANVPKFLSDDLVLFKVRAACVFLSVSVHTFTCVCGSGAVIRRFKFVWLTG